MSVVDEKMALRREIRRRAAAGRHRPSTPVPRVTLQAAMRRATASMRKLSEMLGGSTAQHVDECPERSMQEDAVCW